MSEDTLSPEDNGASGVAGGLSNSRRALRMAVWGMQVALCIVMLPWSVPLVWRRLRGARDEEESDS